MIDTSTTGFRLTRDLLLFAATVALAWLQRWSASDLLWSLWLSSVLLGYSLLLTSVALRPILGLVRGVRENPAAVQEHGASGVVLPAALILAGSAFMVAFFTVHFMGFHFVHSMFLNSFFPLADLGKDSMSLGAYNRLIFAAISRYWPFVLISALAMGTQFRQALEQGSDKTMIMPYRNVIRMHLMIFVIAGLHAGGVSDLALYPTLLLYFFPYTEVRTALKRRASSAHA